MIHNVTPRSQSNRASPFELTASCMRPDGGFGGTTSTSNRSTFHVLLGRGEGGLVGKSLGLLGPRTSTEHLPTRSRSFWSAIGECRVFSFLYSVPWSNMAQRLKSKHIEYIKDIKHIKSV